MFSLQCIEYFSRRGHKLSHIHEMIITTTSDEKYVTYDCCNKQPIQMVEMNLNKMKLRIHI